MAQKVKKQHRSARNTLRRPDLASVEELRSAKALGRLPLGKRMAERSKTPLAGTVVSPDWHSDGRWCFVTGKTWRAAALHRPRSTSDWRRCGDWHYEASDNGLLNADLAAGIRRVKGAKRLGMRLGKWLTADQGRSLLAAPNRGTLRDKRDHAISLAPPRFWFAQSGAHQPEGERPTAEG
jgi:hypothetical protein